MSIVRVFFNPLDAKSEERFEVDDGLLIIDFLQREFPAGFSSPVRIFAGHEELDPDDWDYPIKEHEQITILVMPAEAGFWGYVVAEVLIPALIAVAVGLVINFIFKPKTPGGSDNGDESPIYSIGATKNLARLGAPVEAVYGQVNWPPSYAAAPYSFFSTNFVGANEMWVDELLCLGHGKFELLDVTVGNSSVTDLAPGSVKYWLFDSSQHLQTLGVIEQAVWESVENSEYPQRFYENMFTSPEVSDFIFQSTTNGLVTGWLPISGNMIEGTNGAADRIENVPRTVSVSAGDIITLQNTDNNNITFQVSSVLRDPDTPTTMTVYSQWNSTSFTNESPLNALAEYEINSGTDAARIAGPFRAQRLDQTVNFIWCDFIFPQGLYHRDGTDGDIENASVEFSFIYQQIDPTTGVAIGAPVTRTDFFQAKSLTPYRRSTVSPELPPGAYEVTVERLSEFDDERTVDMTTWVGLRSAIQNDPTQVVYGDTTIMAIRMKATSGLGQAARERIRVTARRILEDDAVDSSSPPVVIKDIFLNPVYGLGREETELDIDQLDKLEADWRGPGGPRFNGAFDQRSTGFDSMESVAAVAGARVVQDGGLLTVIPDQISDIRTALFSTANTIRDSLSILYTFDSYGEYNGMQIEYRDPSNWDASYVYYNPESDDEPSNPDTYTLFGCSDETYAAQYARYLWNVKARRRKEVTLQTELEGLIPKFGDRVGVSTPMPSWGQSGVFVREVNATTWIVDQDLDWTTDNVLIIRNELGTGSTEYSVSQGTAANIVVFAVQPTETIAPADFREPSNYIFGVTGELVRDFMVTKVAPKTDTTLEITAQTYDDLVYEGAPPHMRGETGYACDNYSNAAVKVINAKPDGAVWPLTREGASSDPAIDISVHGHFMPTFNPIYGVADSSMDSCAIRCAGVDGNNGFELLDTSMVTTSGSFGIISKQVGANAVGIMNIRLGNTQFHNAVGIGYEGGGVEIEYRVLGTETVYDLIPAAPTTDWRRLVVNYTTDGLYKLDYTIWVDGDEYTGTLTADSEGSPTITSPGRIRVGALSGTGSLRGQYAFYSSTHLTNSDVLALESAYYATLDT